jgi:lysophospholipase L1-like esterase
MVNKHVRAIIYLSYVVIFCLIVGELALRGFYGYFRDYNMEMWRYASDLKQPLARRNLPFHHYPHRHGCYYGVDISTNSMGMRDREFTIAKPPGRKRVICLGDSFVLGWGVPFDGLFSKRLETMLNSCGTRCEVMNMGIGNYNTTMEVELFKWKCQVLDPDLVVLMYFINDTEPVPSGRSAPAAFVMRHSYCWAFLFDRLVRLRSRLVRSSQWSAYYSDLHSPGNAAGLQANRESVIELAGICKEKGVGLLIVNMPELHKLEDYPFPFATEYIRNLAEEAGVPFLDLHPAFAGYQPESLWVSLEDQHANARANIIMAQWIYDAIRAQGLLD